MKHRKRFISRHGVTSRRAELLANAENFVDKRLCQNFICISFHYLITCAVTTFIIELHFIFLLLILRKSVFINVLNFSNLDKEMHYSLYYARCLTADYNSDFIIYFIIIIIIIIIYLQI